MKPMPTKEATAPVSNPVTPPRFPAIKARNIFIDAGLYFRRVLIKLPQPGTGEVGIRPLDLFEHSGASDAAGPGLWTTVQADRNVPLRKLDDVRVMAHDESWYIDSTIVEADDKIVKFKKAPVIELAVPGQMWADDVVEIFFDGAQKYTVRNKASGAVLMYGYEKLELAKAAYMQSLPKRHAG
jgi:hypothetical protein